MGELAALSTRAGWFNRITFLFFGTKWAARVFYPIGKALRNVLLRLLGISYIENLKAREQAGLTRP